MDERCRIAKTVYTMKAGFYVNVAFAGGSLTVAIGASNTANTTWRRLFMRYLRDMYLPMYRFQISEIYGAMGGLMSCGLAFTLKRQVISHDPTIVFVEEVWNDFTSSPDRMLVKKAVEGCIRQIKSSKTTPDCVLVGVGCRIGAGDKKDGTLDHSLHRELADYYKIPFVDLQSYVNEQLVVRGQKWENIAFDACHLNDYGQQMWYEALRNWFDRQVNIYEIEPAKHETADLPPPLYSDEFQHVLTVDPSRKSKAVRLKGSWEKMEDPEVPWYFENVLKGRTGDKLTFTFKGTGIGVFCQTYNNGLKIEAVLDGKEIAGPYTNYPVEFGTFHMLGHGLKYGEHVLELAVGDKMKNRNRLADPTGRIAYLCVAGVKPDQAE